MDVASQTKVQAIVTFTYVHHVPDILITTARKLPSL